MPLYVGFMTLLFACAIPWISTAVLRRDFDVLEPILLFSALYFMFFGLKPLLFTFGMSDLVFYPGVLDIVQSDPSMVNLILFALALGMISFWIGYLLPHGRMVGKLLYGLFVGGKHSPYHTSLSRSVVIAAIGVGALISSSFRGKYLAAGYTYDLIQDVEANLLSTLSWLLGLGLLAALIAFWSMQKRRAESGFICVVLLLIYFATFSGGRITAVWLLLSLAVVIHYIRGGLKVYHVFIGALFLSLAFYAAIFVRPMVYGIVISPRDVPYYEVFNQLVSRMIGFDALAIVMKLTGTEIASLEGSSLIGLLYGWIPRFVWVDKPALSSAYYFTIQYLGYPSDTPNSMAMTVLGDLFMNFQWVGLISGMFGVGIIVRMVAWLAWRSQKGDTRAVFLYAGVVASLVNIEWNVVIWLTGLVKNLVVTYIVSRYLFIQPKRASF